VSNGNKASLYIVVHKIEIVMLIEVEAESNDRHRRHHQYYHNHYHSSAINTIITHLHHIPTFFTECVQIDWGIVGKYSAWLVIERKVMMT